MYQINMYLETSIRGVRATTGWYGYILEYIDKLGNPHIIEDYDREIDITPNQLGMMAFLEALDRVNKDSEITVYSDSAYLRSGYTRYLQSWKENGWKTAKGEEVKNKVLWQQVSKKTVRHVIRFEPQYHHQYKNQMVMEIEKRKAAEPKQMNMKGMI